MIRRTMDARFLNAVANHPQVRPSLGGDREIDLTAILADGSNIALVTEGGGFVLLEHERGIYEAHTLFLPERRGRAVLEAIGEGLRYLFARTPCLEVVTKAPVSNRAASFMVRRAGFRERFRRDGAWTEADGSLGPVAYFGFTLDDWRRSDALALARGGEFHATLEAAKRAAGSARPQHPHDPAHDRAAGASVLMMEAGNARKAVRAYNRWARLAGYDTAQLLSEQPAVVDVRDAVVEVHQGRMEVLRCR